jgi:hypothetical protein
MHADLTGDFQIRHANLLGNSDYPTGVTHISPAVAMLSRFESLPWVTHPVKSTTLKAVVSFFSAIKHPVAFSRSGCVSRRTSRRLQRNKHFVLIAKEPEF